MAPESAFGAEDKSCAWLFFLLPHGLYVSGYAARVSKHGVTDGIRTGFKKVETDSQDGANAEEYEKHGQAA